jgi:hypothetical protein
VSLTCLSRTLDPTDYVHLSEELQRLDQERPDITEPAARWELALAMRAIDRWREARQSSARTFCAVGTNLADLCVGGTPLVDVISCLSQLERVADPEYYLYQLSCLLAPGGLLVLTFAFWNRCGPDTAIGHQLRQRIFCPKLYTLLRAQALTCHLTPFGGVDPTWHGTTVQDYSLASLVLEKRR